MLLCNAMKWKAIAEHWNETQSRTENWLYIKRGGGREKGK